MKPSYSETRVGKIWALHHEMARRIVLGHSIKAVAKDLNVAPSTVSRVVKTPVIDQKIKALSAERDRQAVDLATHIKAQAPNYFQQMHDIAVGENPNATVKLQYQAAKDLLGIAGFAPVQRVEGTVAHGHFTAEDIEEMKRRAREADVLARGPVLDIQVSGG